MNTTRHLCTLFAAALLFVACDSSPAPDASLPDAAIADGGEPDASGPTCARDIDCSDSMLCNGVEVCRPGNVGTDARGCMAGPVPCLSDQTCDAAMNRCVTDCDANPDADADGVDAVECGGTDCDDSDARRYPGNPELCDDEGLDDDCDSTTLGGTDADSDGHVADTCCNLDADSTLVCGDDCDDAEAAVYGGAAEVCDAFGANGCGLAANPHDADDDGFDDASCGGDDCLDDDATAFPGATETCNGVDNDCSNGGVDDEDVDGDEHAAVGATCTGGYPLDDCDDSDPTAFLGATEVCDGADNDCDADTDEEPTVSDACDAAAPGGAAACLDGACRITTCEAGFASCDGSAATGCEASLTTSPDTCGACGFGCGMGGTCTDGLCDDIEQVAVGERPSGGGHVCVLRASGVVLCWGSNASGQLGNSAAGASSTEPRLVTGLTDAVEIAAAGETTCARRMGGTVECWGQDFGPTPVAVTGIATATQITVGGRHGCAVLDDGTARCWGAGGTGQLGDGGTADSFGVSVAVPGLVDVREIRAGEEHTCAIERVTAYCWGRGDEGQIGDGANVDRLVPTAVSVLGVVRALGAGAFHTCASEGNSFDLYCWGLGSSGQLGRVVATNDPTPTAVPGIAQARAYALGRRHTCVRSATARHRCFGANDRGQLGDGSLTSRATPDFVSNGEPGRFEFNAANGHFAAGGDTVCNAVSFDLVWCWGGNADGQIGDDTTTDTTTPTMVRSLDQVRDVSGREDGACALTRSGLLYCWGYNTDGAVGDASLGGDLGTTARLRPRRVSTFGTDYVQLTSAGGHSCALRTNGDVHCWGSNGSGQLGNGDTASRPRVSREDRVPLTTPTQLVEAGAGRTCALAVDGTVQCWGAGPLGDGSTGDSTSPVPVTGLTDVRRIASGGSYFFGFSCAVRADGTVWCWGINNSSQLGDGSTTQRETPVMIAITDVVDVDAGVNHACALERSGHVSCWGRNFYGQLGDGTNDDHSTPTRVSGLSDAVWLEVNDYRSCAMRATGELVCWGQSTSGSLGVGSSANELSPVAVTAVTGVRRHASGRTGSCSLLDTGTVECWGETGYLGRPNPPRATAAPVLFW